MNTQLPKAVHWTILVCAPKNRREEIAGDIEETFNANIVTKGIKSAKQHLWLDLANSLWPFFVIRAYAIWRFVKWVRDTVSNQ